MADVFGKPRPASKAPSPPDEGVDPFGQTFEAPSPDPAQPKPVLLVPSPKPDKDTRADRDTGETTTGSPPDEGVDPFGQIFEAPSPEPDQPEPVLLVPSPKPGKDTRADRDTGETTTGSPPDEGVDPFGQTFEAPSPEPDQPEPVLLVPSPKPEPVVVDPVVAVTSRPTSVAVPTGPDGETEFSRPVFTGDGEQAAEIERERQVGREILLRRYLRGEEIAPTSRKKLREALGITNAEATHLGLSDFSDGPDLREEPAAFQAAVATINRERQARHEQAIAQYKVDRERYEQYLADKAEYQQNQAEGTEAPRAPLAPPDDGVDPFDPREWEYKPASEAFSTIVAEEPSYAPPDEGADPGRSLDDDVDLTDRWTNVPDPRVPVEATTTIVAPHEGGEYDYHQTPAGLIVAREPEQPRDDTGRFIPSEPTESDNAPTAFSTIVAEDPGAPDEGGEYDYFQTSAGLTVAKLQSGDHLLEEAEAKTFYPHPTPGQTGDALLFESDGARSEIVPENPADYLLEEAPPVLWTPGGETVLDNDYLLGESDGRRPLAESWPTWLPRAHGSYMGHGERRGAGQSHGDGGVLDVLTGGAAWLQGHWDRRVVDPVKRRWPVKDAPENSYSPAQAGQLAAFMPGYGIGLEPSYMTMSPTERRDFATDLMRETPVLSGVAAADTSEGWEKAFHLGTAAIELPWLYGPGRGAGMAMRSAGRMAQNAPKHLPVYGVGGGGLGVARPAKVAKNAFDDFLSEFHKRRPAQDFINDVQADFTATRRRAHGYGDEFDDPGHFEELRAGEDLARIAREESAAYDALVAPELARIRAINAGRAGGWTWGPAGLLVPSQVAKPRVSAPATAQGPDAAHLTTTMGPEDDAALLVNTKVTPTPSAILTVNETAIEEAGADRLANVVKVSPHVDAAPKVKTTGEPSVNLFEEAAEAFMGRMEATTTTAPLTKTKTPAKAAPLPDEVSPAPSTKTKTAPAPTTAPMEVAAPLEVTASDGEPALQPLVFFSPAPSTVKAPLRTAAAVGAQPVVFISSDPAPKTPTSAAAPKVKTTGEPSVNLFEEAAEAFVQTLRPEAIPATPRVFLEEDFSKNVYEPIAVEEVSPVVVTKTAPTAVPKAVTKIAPAWEPVIELSKTPEQPEAVTKVETVTEEPEIKVVVTETPFTPTTEEDGPTTPSGKNRRRPRGSSDDDQDEKAAKRRDRDAHPVVVVHENFVRRAVNLETGKEEIEIPGRRRDEDRPLLAEPRPQPNRPVGEPDDHNGQPGARFGETAEAPDETSPLLASRAVG